MDAYSQIKQYRPIPHLPYNFNYRFREYLHHQVNLEALMKLSDLNKKI